MSETTIMVETTLIAAFDAHVLLDAKLSMKAKAIAAILLASGSWAKEEDVTTDDLIALSTDGRDSILAGLRELEKAGYLTRTRRTGEGGRIYWQRTMRARPKERRPGAAKPSTGLPYTEDPSSLELNSSDNVPSTALPSTANPQVNGGSLELNSSDLEGRTITGKPVHGAGGSTSGESAPTIGGKSGYGAEGLPIRTYTGTGTPASARVDLGSNNSTRLLEEELLDQDQVMDLDPNSSSSYSSQDVDPGSAREGEGSGEGEAGSLELSSSDTTSDPVLAKMCFQMLTTCGVRATAGRLYPRYAFEHIRAEVVRYLEQYTTEFARERNAGVVVYRIKNSAYVPLSEAERMGSTYLQWRTEAERIADQRALAGRSLELNSSDFAVEPDPSQPVHDWHVEHLGRGAALRSSMLRVDRNAPPADPLWVDVMRELALSGLEHLNGSSGMRLADGSWLIYVAEPSHLQWLEHRGVKQVVRTLGPMTGTPIAGLKVAFTADRAAYLEATGGH